VNPATGDKMGEEIALTPEQVSPIPLLYLSLYALSFVFKEFLQVEEAVARARQAQKVWLVVALFREM
jgi:hypothetical protein